MKAIVSLSGGMDSATLLATALEEKREVQAVGFCYGSKHNAYENDAANMVACHYGVPYRLIDLSNVFSLFRSSLLKKGGDIPEGHYQEESMRQTVVPARNVIFCSVLAGLAVSEGAGEVWLGVHAGDHYIYPDCRPSFIDKMRLALQYGTNTDLALKTPFLYMNKAEILTTGLNLKNPVPYHLTRTCYKAQEVACGRCGSCQERLEAFDRISLPDPVEYETRELLPKKGG